MLCLYAGLYMKHFPGFGVSSCMNATRELGIRSPVHLPVIDIVDTNPLFHAVRCESVLLSAFA
jgi:hypothetical protein